MVLVSAKLVYSTTLVSYSRNSAVALLTAVCSSASSVLSESMLSNTFFLLMNLNCGAALWNPVTWSISPTRGRRHGLQVEPEVAFRGCIHGTSLGQTTTVIVKSGYILCHCTRNNNVKIFGVGPNPLNNPFPILTFTLSGDELSQLRVGPQDLSNAIPDGNKPDRTEEAGGEHGADTENFVAHQQATNHLSIHALEGVDAEDWLVRACVNVVGIVRSVLELLAVVVARQHWTCKFMTGIRRLYNFCRRSISSGIVGINFLSPALVPELATASFSQAGGPRGEDDTIESTPMIGKSRTELVAGKSRANGLNWWQVANDEIDMIEEIDVYKLVCRIGE
nr:Os01g0764850 [Ipomoea batatas]